MVPRANQIHAVFPTTVGLGAAGRETPTLIGIPPKHQSIVFARSIKLARAAAKSALSMPADGTVRPVNR
jgi:hypothetical protein